MGELEPTEAETLEHCAALFVEGSDAINDSARSQFDDCNHFDHHSSHCHKSRGFAQWDMDYPCDDNDRMDE